MPQLTNKYTLKSSSRRILTLVILLAWLVVLGLVALNRQNLLDWWELRDYKAPAAVAQLAGQDTMTPYGKKIFFVNHPAIEAKSNFGTACPNNGGEQTIVLGCYHGNQDGIYLLSVTDPRLEGVVPVTAAHEMLHAAYDRLSASDRKQVNAMLLDYYHNNLHDQRLLKTLDAYKKSEPKDVVNEMHSIFGTEVASLPPALEHYYQRYFTNRSQVATLASRYQAEFTSRQALVAQDDAQLASLKTEIENAESDLKNQQAAINTQQDALLSLRKSGNYTAYNAGVPAYNHLIDVYNAAVENVQGLISRYNQLVAERNAVALEEDQLIKNLSSDATPLQH